MEVHSHKRIFPKFIRDVIYAYYFPHTTQRLSNSVKSLSILTSNTIPQIQTLRCSTHFRLKNSAHSFGPLFLTRFTKDNSITLNPHFTYFTTKQLLHTDVQLKIFSHHDINYLKLMYFVFFFFEFSFYKSFYTKLNKFQ